MITIENEILKAVINPKGAELISLFHKQNQTEYMWGADPAFWGKSSPVLFPIVGALKDNLYRFKGKDYTLPRHGFARDKHFNVEELSLDDVNFQLHHDESTLEVFPFPFEFTIHYALKSNLLEVKYQVKNVGTDEMWFSVGGHPAFNVPLVENTEYEDYLLKFNRKEDFYRWPLTNGGLIRTAPYLEFETTDEIHISKELFAKDALVFKHLKSTNVILQSGKISTQLKFNFEGFPFLGIWAAPQADFVCIEPWCGIADSENHNQELTEKEGINRLNPGEVFEKVWSVELN